MKVRIKSIIRDISANGVRNSKEASVSSQNYIYVTIKLEDGNKFHL